MSEYVITKEAYEGDIVSRLRNWRGLHLAHGGKLFEEAADEIEALRGSGWISVGDGVPSLDWDGMSAQVLVATADGITWIGRYEKDEHSERWCIETTSPVTAWMPLPEPPQ